MKLVAAAVLSVLLKVRKVLGGAMQSMLIGRKLWHKGIFFFCVLTSKRIHSTINLWKK